MDFDQAFAGNVDWNFPSPTATPTNVNFAGNLLQTPKTATFPSHFQDAFRTPQMPSHTTPQQPHYALTTPVQRPHTSSDTLRSNYYAQVQANGSQSMHNAAQVAFDQPAYSPIPPNHFQATQGQHAMQGPFQSVQMQTPPPTRGTSAKKSLQPAQIAFGTPSTIASRRFTTPQQLGTSNDAVPQPPMQYPQLQFSPDMYQHANMGPATAPVMPQTQLLWAQMQSPQPFAQPPTLDDPFIPATSQGMTWPDQSPQQPMLAQAPMFGTPAMASFSVQSPHPRPASAMAESHTSAAPAVPQVNSASLDPSLIYSSPLRPVMRSGSLTGKGKAGLQHSLSRSMRKDSAISASQPSQQSKNSTSPMTAIPEANGIGLRKSNTTGSTRVQSAKPTASAIELLGRSASSTQVPRTSSPLKRTGTTPLGSISEHKAKRASVILTVDENGMARTRTIGGPPEPSPTKSIRDRYPGLWDSDTSEDESETEDQVSNRSASFSFASFDERRSKAARLDPPVENLDGIDILRSKSRSSARGVTPSKAAVAAAASLRRQSSSRRPSRTTPSKRIATTSSMSSLIDSAPMNMSTSQRQTRAGAELASSQMLGNEDDWTLNIPRSGSRSAHALDAHNRRWSMMSFDQQSVSPQHGPGFLPRFRPSHQPAQAAPMLIRCVCGADTDSGQMMVQCTSCTQWLHADCVGVDGNRPPPRFTCFLCTRPPVHR